MDKGYGGGRGTIKIPPLDTTMESKYNDSQVERKHM